jgi:hypothetical protein
MILFAFFSKTDIGLFPKPYRSLDAVLAASDRILFSTCHGIDYRIVGGG